MSKIKLIDLAKELGVGVNSVQEEITKRGMLGEKNPTPNTRLE